MIKHEEIRKIILFVPEDEIKLQTYIKQQEKKDEIIENIKDILALNYSYQEIGIKISRLFKSLEEEMK